MRLWIFSDLHLAFSPVKTPLEIPSADVCVVAGDVHVRGPARSVEWLGEHVAPHMPVVFVCGNHEFYHSTVTEGLFNGSAAAAAFPSVHFLENGYVEIGDVLFAGAALWTNFEIMGSQRFAREYAEQVMNDYRQIALTKKPFTRLRPFHTLRMHEESKRFLQRFLDDSRERKTVVVSHHAPSRRSIAQQYSADITSAAFASDLEAMIRDAGPTVWVHGHVHQAYDYRIAETRIVCNPRGYPDEPSFDNFEFKLTIEI